MTTPFNSRQLHLIPTVWRQELKSSTPQLSLQENRWLSFHAETNDWLFGHAFSDMLFEINISSDAAMKGRGKRSAELEDTIGVLALYEGTQDSSTGQKEKTFVAGGFSVSDSVFEDLWERVKLKVALPCDVWLEVLGVQMPDPTPGKENSDDQKQFTLKVFSLNVRFSTELSNLALSNNGGKSKEKKGNTSQ